MVSTILNVGFGHGGTGGHGCGGGHGGIGGHGVGGGGDGPGGAGSKKGVGKRK